MALQSKSLFLYNLQVTTLNRSIDFKAASGGPTLMATVDLGYYSLTDLMNAIAAAMNAADTTNNYTVTADRTVSGGTQNRVTISTSGTFLSLLFGTGPRIASSIAPLIGFPATDQTGSTHYTGTSSTGTILRPTLYGYNYLPPDRDKKAFGAVNISASGLKEAVVFQIQKFFEVQFMYEPNSFVISDWVPFIEWIIQQRPLEFTPEISSPNTVYNCTLESTDADGEGMALEMKEMLPDYPFTYDTGLLKFRIKV
jgi:hypothetical protein